MSMTSITIICRPTKDPELRTSPSGVTYTTLDVAVTKGYGDKEHPNYFRAFCKNEMAQRVINAGVKKGSLIYITGDLDIRPYTKRTEQPEFPMRSPYSTGDMSIPANQRRMTTPRHRTMQQHRAFLHSLRLPR